MTHRERRPFCILMPIFYSAADLPAHSYGDEAEGYFGYHDLQDVDGVDEAR